MFSSRKSSEQVRQTHISAASVGVTADSAGGVGGVGIGESHLDLIQRHQVLFNNASALPIVAVTPTINLAHVPIYIPTTYSGAAIPPQELAFHVTSGGPPDAVRLPTHADVRHADGRVESKLKMGEIIESHIDAASQMEITLVSLAGSNGSLVVGYNGLGAKWLIQGILRIKNRHVSQTTQIAQVTVNLDASAGGRFLRYSEDGCSPYTAPILPHPVYILASSVAFPPQSVMYFPFIFEIGQTLPPAFAAPYISLSSPYTRHKLNISLLTIFSQTIQHNHDIAVPYFHRALVRSLLAPQLPLSAKKAMPGYLSWEAFVKEPIAGKGEAFEVTVVAHQGAPFFSNLHFIQLELREVVGYLDSSNGGGTRIVQQLCTKNKLTLTPAPIGLPLSQPHTLSVAIPKQVPSTHTMTAFAPTTAINACTPDGQYFGYLVSHVLRVALYGPAGPSKKQMQQSVVLEFMEVPVVVASCDKKGCAALSNQFPHIVEAMVASASLAPGVAPGVVAPAIADAPPPALQG